MAHPTSTQPEAMRLADRLDSSDPQFDDCTDAAAELRRLYAANIDCVDHFNTCKAERDELLQALIDIKYGLEGARIWGGMEWTYNPLHPFKYLLLVEKASAAIAKATGGQA